MILSFVTAALLAPQAGLTTDQVLGQVRKAVHFQAYRAYPNGLRLQGDAHVSGEDGKFTLEYVPGGRYLNRYIVPNLGKSPFSSGFDGRGYWSSDWSGATVTVDPLSGGERALAIDAQTHGWLSPARHYAVKVGAANDKGISVKLASKDGYALATVMIDRQTWLPRSMTIHNSSSPAVITLVDYRTERDVLLPHTISDERGGVTETRTVRTVDVLAAGSQTRYGMPAWKPTDTTFDKTRRADLRSVRGPGGHMMVYASVAGKDGWFIFDSGASAMVIDSKFADEVKLPKVGEITLAGIAGHVTMHYRPAPEMMVGPVKMKDVLFSEYNLSALGDGFGVPVSGIIGYDLFRRTVAEVDFASNHVALYDPATYKLPRSAWQPLGFARKGPYVIASFGKGRSGPFRLDSGASSNVIFHTPAVQRYGLGKGQKLEHSGLGGVGGQVSAGLGKIESFTLGGKTFQNPTVTFATEAKGLVADRFLIGNIGQPFMESFRLVYDYSHSRIAFLPR